MMSFGALLRHHRLTAQLTQEELAERASVSTRSVSDIERGISQTPQKATVQSLAEALCLAGEDLETFEATARASRRTTDPTQREEGASLLVPEATVAQAETGSQIGGSAAWRSRLRRPTWVIIALVAALTFPLAFTLSRASPHSPPARSTFAPWGWSSGSLRAWVARQEPSAAPTQFDHPSNVAVDARGNVYVADALADTITKLAPNGHLLARMGAPGAGRGQFDLPTGLAIDHRGDVYVTDTNNNRVQELSPSGKWLAWWGMPVSHLNYVSGPTGVAVDARDNVYVAVSGSAQIVKLSSTGAVLARWSPRLFKDPKALAVAGDGTVYVADSVAGTIVRLSPHGRLLSVWRFPDFVPGQYAYPTGYPFAVAVGTGGAVYVTDTYHDRVLTLSPSGQVQTIWGRPGSGPGEFDVPLGIAVDRDGHLYVGDKNNHRVQKFSPAGVPLPAWGASPPPASDFDAPRALATDRSSHVYILEGQDPPRLQELSPQGLPVREMVLKSLHQGDVLSGFAVDDAGVVYIADGVHNRVDMIGPTGKLLAAWGTAGTGRGHLHAPTDVAVRRGRIYVADSDSQGVQIFSPSRRPVGDMYATGYPQSVAVDSRQRVYVADPVRHVVATFSASGRPLSVIGRGAPGALRLRKPIAVAVDGRGNVYVADAGDERVVEVSATGRLLGSWGGVGAFVHLQDVAVAPDGSVFALDGGTGHVLKLNRPTR